MTGHELYLLHLGQLGSRDEATGETHFNQVPGYLIRTARVIGLSPWPPRPAPI